RADLCHAAASPEVLLTLFGRERADAALEYAQSLNYGKFIPYMRPEPHLFDVLSTLSETFPLAVATNRGTSMPDILVHFDLSAYFTTVITSRD
ncbi:MAG: hypothetical protein GWN87_25215, partial [Desulfuromonadales bacterium]|nr:hypothetical protein [Desulfuromonadales bacterium]NIS43106.1 hypothetical protein [Desulfuromonadales bacterium]